MSRNNRHPDASSIQRPGDFAPTPRPLVAAAALALVSTVVIGIGGYSYYSAKQGIDAETAAMRADGFNNVQNMPAPWDRLLPSTRANKFHVVIKLGKCPLSMEVDPAINEAGTIVDVAGYKVLNNGVATTVHSRDELYAEYGPGPCTTPHLTGNPASTNPRQ